MCVVCRKSKERIRRQLYEIVLRYYIIYGGVSDCLEKWKKGLVAIHHIADIT
jgi:hypothetical protein